MDRSHFWAFVMAWAGACATGKTSLVVINRISIPTLPAISSTPYGAYWSLDVLNNLTPTELRTSRIGAHSICSTTAIFQEVSSDFRDKDIWPSNLRISI
ncbi:hypothetical protein KIN20_033290 [Parelaphostrongylus tenuis]|uniref:Secreted protein n=1 Tax=Parelaphostrongylus tenuis TaxID=148309 RepID=A0AAD5WJ33_PARTN|nr:hypothetical protein KIN20_033290 [Parelaphostrongylus tenuis]